MICMLLISLPINDNTRSRRHVVGSILVTRLHLKYKITWFAMQYWSKFDELDQWCRNCDNMDHSDNIDYKCRWFDHFCCDGIGRNLMKLTNQVELRIYSMRDFLASTMLRKMTDITTKRMLHTVHTPFSVIPTYVLHTASIIRPIL